MKLLDRYITRKFLGTFFFSLGLIILIAVVFDISEKLDDFIEKKAPLEKIIFDYYLNFIPYFANLFAPLFVFISVIFFTSRMAANTEIVAILNSGVSFRRLLYPYLLSSAIITTLLIYFNGWVIPHSNKVKLEFENTYIKNPVTFNLRNIHRQIDPGTFVYLESYNNSENIGYRFSMEKLEKGQRVWYLNSDRIRWDSTTSRWHIERFYVRSFDGQRESMYNGISLDTVLDMHPSDFRRRLNIVEAMDNPTLTAFIREEREQGSNNINPYLVEKYKRFAVPFSTFILTLIGVSLSSRKTRGGIGAQLGLGITLSFSYILFMQVFNTFAASGAMPPVIAVWIPNLIYAGIAFYLVRVAPK